MFCRPVALPRARCLAVRATDTQPVSVGVVPRAALCCAQQHSCVLCTPTLLARPLHSALHHAFSTLFYAVPLSSLALRPYLPSPSLVPFAARHRPPPQKKAGDTAQATTEKYGLEAGLFKVIRRRRGGGRERRTVGRACRPWSKAWGW